jgi:hypothetical protein
MPLHEGRKSHLVTATDEVLQQLPIGHSGPIPQEHSPAEVLKDLTNLAGHHVGSIVGAPRAL